MASLFDANASESSLKRSESLSHSLFHLRAEMPPPCNNKDTVVNACDSFIWHNMVLRNSVDTFYTYVNSSGCTVTDTLRLTIYVYMPGSIEKSFCGSFTWNGQTYTQAGQYLTTSVKGPAGCVVMDTLKLSYASSLYTYLPAWTICYRFLPFNWRGKKITGAGLYYDTLRTKNGACDSILVQEVKVLTPQPPDLDSPLYICQFSPVVSLLPYGGDSVRWFNSLTQNWFMGNATAPAPQTSDTGTRIYYVSKKSGSNFFCESRKMTVVVKVVPNPELGPPKDLLICDGASADLRGVYSGDYSGNWIYSGAAVTDPSKVKLPGDYLFCLTDSFGCKDTGLLRLSMRPPVPAYAGPDDSVKFEEPYQLDGSGGIKYLWSPGYPELNDPTLENPTAIIDKDTRFIMMAEDVNQCRGYDTVQLNVIYPEEVRFPTAFTPNGDGLNDIFQPVPWAGVKQVDFFRVYDRFGRLIFDAGDSKIGWNGRFKGVIQNQGYYIWHFNGINQRGKRLKEKGNVLLIR
jgi:gliding motility-associated-like protein